MKFIIPKNKKSDLIPLFGPLWNDNHEKLELFSYVLKENEIINHIGYEFFENNYIDPNDFLD